MKKKIPLALFLSTFLLALSASADVPQILSYVGYLEEDGAPYDGTASIVFTLYDDETAGTAVWTETYASVPVVGGELIVDLGSQTPLSPDVLNGNTLYLAVTVNGQALSPRTPVFSSPYAVRAQVAGELEGFDPSAYAKLNDLSGYAKLDDLSGYATTNDLSDYAKLSALSTSGGASVHWNNLTNIPGDLADGDNNTTYSAGGSLTLTGNVFDLKPGGVGTNHLADGSVTGAKIAAGAVGSAHLANGSVGTSALANDAVNSAKIANNAVTSLKIAAGAVGNTDLADNAVTSAKIANNAVTSLKIAAGAVGSAHLANGSVGTSALAADAVTSSKIKDGEVKNADLENNAVTRSKIYGAEVALYRDSYDVCNFSARGSDIVRTTPSCNTRGCGLGTYYSCTGQCNKTFPQSCTLQKVGYLISPNATE